MLHEVAAGIIGDDGMGNALLQQLVGSDGGTLVARPGFIYPHMDGDTSLLGSVDRRRGCAMINTSQPARIAVGEDIDGFAFLFAADFFNQLQPVLTDELALLYAFLRYVMGGLQGGCGYSGRVVSMFDSCHDALEGVGQVDGSGAGISQQLGTLF